MKKIPGLFLLSLFSLSALSCSPSVNDPGGGTTASSHSPSDGAIPEPGISTSPTSPGIQSTVSTFAGSKRGFADGSGTNAMFEKPDGLAIDRNNNIYVADSFNNRIRKITPAGVVTTVAGSGIRGYKDGPATEAQFGSLAGIAVDDSGNLFVADESNNCIRKITPGGMVSTLAGDGSQGLNPGSGTITKLNSPQGLALDKSGSLYVADRKNHVIRLINPAGIVTTFAGTLGQSGFVEGNKTTARFNEPYGVAIDNNGNIFVGDTVNRRIRKISGGEVSTFAGNESSFDKDGTGTEAQFVNPHLISSDSSGIIYFGANGKIKQLTADARVTSIAGRGNSTPLTNGPGKDATFSNPAGIVKDSNGNLFVADSGNNLIRKVELN